MNQEILPCDDRGPFPKPEAKRCQLRGCERKRDYELDLGADSSLGLCEHHVMRWIRSGAYKRASFQLAEWRRLVEAELANGQEEK